MELCYLAQTLCLLREVIFGVTENSLMSLEGQKENVSNKVNSPPIRDFMNERYQDIQFKKFLNLIFKIYRSGAVSYHQN